MIYARFGDTVESIRYATPDDVKRLDPPLDKEAKTNLANKSWVVIEVAGQEMISHLCYLRADSGLPEIMKAIDRNPEGTRYE